MEKNNGKIAIAIVAMFVVALSVVGFTYAYFTAQVQGNTADKSVEVTAGKLAIVYANGNEIFAQNLVPGWVSDGKHFYDSQYSQAVDQDGNYLVDDDDNYKIIAVSTDVAGCTKKSDESTPGSADGITDPVTFSVSNDAENAGDNWYIIRLTGIANGLVGDDKNNFYITLYNADTDAVIWNGNLAADSLTAPQTIVSAPIEIKKDDAAQNYEIVATYRNIDGPQSSKGVSVKATVEVIGVVKATAADETNGVAIGDWIDADGKKVSFGTANTDTPNNGINVESTTYYYSCATGE